MTKPPKVGDRVCITPKNRLTCFLPGDRGEVLAGPEVVAGSKLRYYLVATGPRCIGGRGGRRGAGRI
jgi:hypothetical protein